MNNGTFRPSGSQYDLTTGALIDYRQLAHQLCGVIGTKCDHLIDAPCGTLELLHCLRPLYPKAMLVGIDSDIRQLLHGREKYANDGCLALCADVLNGAWIANNPRLMAAVHIGYCFCNVLGTDARRRVLESLFSSPSIVSCVLEFQNEVHQAHFAPGKWYSWKSPGGTPYRTRSFPLGEQLRQLEMEFTVDGRCKQTTDYLHSVTLEEFSAMCRRIGWSVDYRSAEYRESVFPINSHWLAHLTRE